MVVNMSRKVFEAKDEMRILCNKFKIDYDYLIFLEKPKGKESLDRRINETVLRVGDEVIKISDKSIELILTDHHAPIEELRRFKLDTVIDHHILSEKSLFAKRIYNDIGMGSCCTLVSQFLGQSLVSSKEARNKYFENSDFRKMLSMMLSIPIYFDTKYLTKNASVKDKAEFDKLISLAANGNKGMIYDDILNDITETVKLMKKSRKNDSKLDNDLILLKDFKKFDVGRHIFGYSTVKYDFEEWVDREAQEYKNKKEAGLKLFKILDKFRTEQGLDFLIVNRKFHDKRFLILVNCPLEKDLVKENIIYPLSYKSLIYYKTDVKNTRKIIAPILKHKLSIL